MRGRHLTVIGAIIILLAATCGYWYWLQHHIRTNNAYLKANMILVSPKVTGFIEKIHAQDNQWVKAGSPLFTIEKRDYQDRVIQAEADVEAQIAKQQNLSHQENLQRAVIAEIKAMLQAKEATLSEVQKNYKRIRTLNKRKVASANQLDSAIAKQKNAESAVLQVKAKLIAAENQLQAIHASIAGIQAGIKKAKATLALNRRMLNDTVIKAPFDGVFTNRGVYVGQLVHPAINLAHLVAQNNIWVEANYKENQMQQIAKGQHATIEVDAYPKVHFDGIVESISPASGAEFSILPPENATGNFTKIVRRIPIKIQIRSPQDKLALLKSGLSATVTIDIP